MVRAAQLNEQNQVLEVGAGTGQLTYALAETGARVLAYEVDRGLLPILQSSLSDLPLVEIRAEDILAVDLNRSLSPGQWVMVANLPYNIGTSLLLRTMLEVPCLCRWVVMVQTEVAQRLLAVPDTSVYGLPSLVVSFFGKAQRLFEVGPQVFYPIPAVNSTVIKIERTNPPPLARPALALARTAFGQRRKMLRNSLKDAIAEPITKMSQTGIAETARPQELSPNDWLALARVTRTE